MELLRLPPVIPLFPLANHVLLPGLPRPYHIFEPRYRAMVRDLLARPESERWLAIPCVRAEARDDDARPPIHDVATAALLVAHERLPDGRFNIVVYGMERCALEEIDSDRPYRVARASLIAEVDPADKSFSLQSSVDALGQLAARYVASRGGSAQALRIVREDEDQHLFVHRLGAALLNHTDARLRFLRANDIKQRVDLLFEALMESLGGDDAKASGAFLA